MQVVGTYLDKEFFVHDSSVPWVKELGERHHKIPLRLVSSSTKGKDGK
ncbi:MAG: hypothetical protein IJX00_01670 [Clostridia bacterium]|nr:hypothetical protein [Clostridia bacterium]